MKKNGNKQKQIKRFGDGEKPKSFGHQLKAFLDKEGRKYRWICDNTSINWARLQRVFNGSEPSMSEMQEIANLLGMTVDDLYHLEKLQPITK